MTNNYQHLVVALLLRPL